MPHVDMETLVSSCVGGTDRKVNCETIANGFGREDFPDDDVDFVVDDIPPDLPPESFWLSKDAEFDWFDHNSFFERKESGKGISNSTNLSANKSSNFISQQFSKNIKSSLFGLPNTQKTNYLESKRRINKPAHLFPKRSESTGKSSVTVVEPSSPKVSCIGRVRSKRSRHKSNESKKMRGKSSGKSETDRKKGFYSRMFSIFKVNSGCAEIETGRPSDEIVMKSIVEQAPRKSTALRMCELQVGTDRRDEEVCAGSGRHSGTETTDD